MATASMTTKPMSCERAKFTTRRNLTPPAAVRPEAESNRQKAVGGQPEAVGGKQKALNNKAETFQVSALFVLARGSSRSYLLLTASCLLWSALPLTLLDNRLAVKRHGAAAEMTARVECSFVIAADPGVISRPDAYHSGLHPIAEFARGPNLQIRIDAKIDVAQQIFAGIGGRVVGFFHSVKAWSS